MSAAPGRPPAPSPPRPANRLPPPAPHSPSRSRTAPLLAVVATVAGIALIAFVAGVIALGLSAGQQRTSIDLAGGEPSVHADALLPQAESSSASSASDSGDGGAAAEVITPRAHVGGGDSTKDRSVAEVNTGTRELPADTALSSALGADPVKEALSAVAVVQLPDGHGSGFMAAPNLLVTNYHVIGTGRMTDVRVGFPDNSSARGRAFAAELLAEDPVHDLALLRVKCDVPPLRIDEAYEHVNGQKVVAIGSPGTGDPGEMLANLTTDGRLGPPYPMPNGSLRWALSMSVNAGNSGGPIIDATRGQVVGVVVAKFTKTDSQSLAVPLPTLIEMLRSAQSADSTAIRRAAACHRARFCLQHMVRLQQLAALSFEKSYEEATAAEHTTTEARLAAFNEFKSDASRILSDEFALFETTVAAEVDALRNDPDCDASDRLAISKLHATIENQVEDLRKSVPLREIDHFVRDFRDSLTRGASLAQSVAQSLSLEIEE